MASDCWGAQLSSLEMVSTGMLPSRHSTQVAHCLFHLNQDISRLHLGRTTGCVLRTSCWSCDTTQGCTGIDHIKWVKLSVIHTSEAHQSHTGARHSRLSQDGMGWNVISVMHDDKIWQDWTLWKAYPSCLSVSATWFQVEVAYSFLQHLSRDAKAAHPFTKQTLYRRLLLDETSSVRARWIGKVQVKSHFEMMLNDLWSHRSKKKGSCSLSRSELSLWQKVADLCSDFQLSRHFRRLGGKRLPNEHELTWGTLLLCFYGTNVFQKL
jgi:hypothetical protein